MVAIAKHLLDFICSGNILFFYLSPTPKLLEPSTNLLASRQDPVDVDRGHQLLKSLGALRILLLQGERGRGRDGGSGGAAPSADVTGEEEASAEDPEVGQTPEEAIVIPRNRLAKSAAKTPEFKRKEKVLKSVRDYDLQGVS